MEQNNRLKICVHTLGCKVNQYESELICEKFASNGDEIVGEDEFADVYIINTCTVTGTADKKSRQFIRRMKRINPEAVIVVTGCYAQVSKEEVERIEEVDIVIGNNLKSTIYEKVHENYNKKKISGDKIVNVLNYSELSFYENMGKNNNLNKSRSRAYIKIEDGCNRFCSYCMIPFARGPIRSRDKSDIIEEAKTLIENGVKEIVLTGINTALYGFDFNSNVDYPLADLIREINSINGDFRIRLSSLEPTVVDVNDVMNLVGYEKLCRHLHLSVQSGSNNVLQNMNRSYNVNDYINIVTALKEFDPLYGITTDIIVGFPSETEKDFAESMSLVKDTEFCRIHAFKYSERKNTKAASLSGKISEKIKNERIKNLIKEGRIASYNFIKKNIGTYHKLLTEERYGDYIAGYTGNYIKTYVNDPEKKLKTDEFYEVKIEEVFKDGCLASLKVVE